jgi:hypothetical protein
LPLDWLEPLLEDVVEELDVEELDVPLEPEEVVLLAVGVEEALVRVLDEPEPVDLLDVPDVPELVPDVLDVPELVLELLCVAFGTVAATASEPTMPLAATIVVMAAVRALPCRTDFSAPSASMAVS